MKTKENNVREPARLQQHYEIERELADRLRFADPELRRGLYRKVYDELFQRVPDHPQLVRKHDRHAQCVANERQLALLSRWLTPESVYMEIGPGDCHLASTVARRVLWAYAVDVSNEIVRGTDFPRNLTLVLSDGVTIDVPTGSVQVAYSHQLVEHLHPDDAALHLQEVRRVLAPGGLYVCITPHRYSGPHDVSRFFDREATGFHLKEYTYHEISDLLIRAGFVKTEVWVGLKGRYWRFPNTLIQMTETMVGRLTYKPRKWMVRSLPLRIGFDSLIITGIVAG